MTAYEILRTAHDLPERYFRDGEFFPCWSPEQPEEDRVPGEPPCMERFEFLIFWQLVMLSEGVYRG